MGCSADGGKAISIFGFDSFSLDCKLKITMIENEPRHRVLLPPSPPPPFLLLMAAVRLAKCIFKFMCVVGFLLLLSSAIYSQLTHDSRCRRSRTMRRKWWRAGVCHISASNGYIFIHRCTSVRTFYYYYSASVANKPSDVPRIFRLAVTVGLCWLQR